jgi:hopanoid-associated phosphorylase
VTADTTALIAVATGLLAEARLFERAGGVRAIAGGGDAASLAASLERAIADGARAVMSFGIAGGLSPDVVPGDVVVGQSVIVVDERYATDVAWCRRLNALLTGARLGTIAASDIPVATREAKAALHLATGAIVTDMESDIAARVAARHKLPFAILRVVADSANCALPPAALAGLSPGGAINVAAVLKSLMRRPSQLSQLLRVSTDTSTAMKALLRCYRLLGPGLGFVDLG